MDKKVMVILAIACIIALAFITIFVIAGFPLIPGSKDCVTDSDCISYGTKGDCNCGCYNKNNQPFAIKGFSTMQCFCAPPVSCKCQQNKCVSG